MKPDRQYAAILLRLACLEGDAVGLILRLLVEVARLRKRVRELERKCKGQHKMHHTVEDFHEFAKYMTRMTEEQVLQFGNHPTICHCDGCIEFASYVSIKHICNSWESWLTRRYDACRAGHKIPPEVSHEEVLERR